MPSVRQRATAGWLSSFWAGAVACLPSATPGSDNGTSSADSAAASDDAEADGGSNDSGSGGHDEIEPLAVCADGFKSIPGGITDDFVDELTASKWMLGFGGIVEFADDHAWNGDADTAFCDTGEWRVEGGHLELVAAFDYRRGGTSDKCPHRIRRISEAFIYDDHLYHTNCVTTVLVPEESGDKLDGTWRSATAHEVQWEDDDDKALTTYETFVSQLELTISGEEFSLVVDSCYGRLDFGEAEERRPRTEASGRVEREGENIRFVAETGGDLPFDLEARYLEQRLVLNIGLLLRDDFGYGMAGPSSYCFRAQEDGRSENVERFR